MLLISIDNGKKFLYHIALVRVSEFGKNYLYKVKILNNKNVYLDFEFLYLFPYGCGIKLSTAVLEEILSLCEKYNNNLLGILDSGQSNFNTLNIKLSINNKKIIQYFKLSKRRIEDSYKIIALSNINDEKIDTKLVSYFDKNDDFFIFRTIINSMKTFEESDFCFNEFYELLNLKSQFDI